MSSLSFSLCGNWLGRANRPVTKDMGALLDLRSQANPRSQMESFHRAVGNTPGNARLN